MQINVGGQTFSVPEGSIYSAEIGQHYNRDPKIFRFIHRWLQGYSAHLPSQEWEILCLFEDCRYFQVDRLLSELLVILAESRQDVLGRKAILIQNFPDLFSLPDLNQPLDSMISSILQNYPVDFKSFISLFSHLLPYQAGSELQLLLKTASGKVDWSEVNHFIFKQLLLQFGLIWPQDFPFHSNTVPSQPQEPQPTQQQKKSRNLRPPQTSS